MENQRGKESELILQELLNIANRESVDFSKEYIEAELSFFNLAGNIIAVIDSQLKLEGLADTLRYGDAVLADVNVVPIIES